MFSFVATNQLDSALSEAQRAAQIDPMAMSYNVGWMLQAAGRHTEAVAELQKTLALDSTNVNALSRIAPSLVALGRCDDALRAITPLHAERYSFNGMTIGYVLASCNRRAEARIHDFSRSSPGCGFPDPLTASHLRGGTERKPNAPRLPLMPGGVGRNGQRNGQQERTVPASATFLDRFANPSDESVVNGLISL